MNSRVYVCEVTEKNFSSVVLENSHKLPVLVIFMGVWSEPCFIVSDIFSGLAKEFAGKFVLAKVDIDEQPALRAQYQIENVPALMVFRQGEITRVEMGQLEEQAARTLLYELGVFHESDELREQARQKHLAGDTAGAVGLLTKAIKLHPSNTRVAMDMVQIFIDVGDTVSAQDLFSKLPEYEQISDVGKTLRSQLTFNEYAAKTKGIEALQLQLENNPADAQSRFDLAVCLMARHDYQGAVDHLFKIMESNSEFRGGAAKEAIIMIVKMLTPTSPALAKTYQRKLSSLLMQ